MKSPWWYHLLHWRRRNALLDWLARLAAWDDD